MVEDGVKGGVEDTHEPFEDSNGKIEDTTVNLNENEGRGRFSL